MQSIIHFFQRNSPFFTWLLLAVGSVVLLCQTNPYHRSVWFGSASRLAGSVYESVAGITGYFGLRTANEELLQRAGDLAAENLRLRQRLQQYADAAQLQADTTTLYTYSIAHVVGNSVHQAANYITLDKGTADGVTADMAVANQNGVVGFVAAASDHFSLVISLLNPHFKLSAMVQHTEAAGLLSWDGADARHAQLLQLPRSVICQVGDTVVTSSYSSAFPQGVPVGTVEAKFDDGTSFLGLQLRLFVDFSRLNDVHVIHYSRQEEQMALERQIKQ